MSNDSRNIGYYLQRARWDCNKSQEYLANELGVARKTVQNWEKGVSEPSLTQLINWFDALNVNPMPYIFRYCYHDSYSQDSDDDKKVRKILSDMIMDIPIENVKQLLFLLDGNHGSSARALLQMMIAHIQTPMKDRYNQASLIFGNYKLAKEKGELTDIDEVQPDEEILTKAIEEGRKAVITGENEYTML